MKTTKIIIRAKSNNYPIVIGSNLIKSLLNIAKRNSLNSNKCLLVVDGNVPKKFII